MKESLEYKNSNLAITANICIGFIFRAPQGCVQYFMEPSGTFQSYGYQNSQMLVNQQYATCFRKNLGNWAYLNL